MSGVALVRHNHAAGLDRPSSAAALRFEDEAIARREVGGGINHGDDLTIAVRRHVLNRRWSCLVWSDGEAVIALLWDEGRGRRAWLAALTEPARARIYEAGG